LSAVPRTFTEFLAARVISGLGIGASSMICPIYIAELAPAGKRGRLGSLFQMGIVAGIFLTLFINAQIQGLGDEAWNAARGWRWMLAAEVAPAVLLVSLLFVAPESPRWLLQAGRDDEAREILASVGGPEHAQAEITAVHEVLRREEGGFGELFGPLARQPLVVAVVLMAVSQLCGINAIMYYSTKIFTTAGVGVKDSFMASAVIGLVNVLFTFVALALVDRAGRKALLVVGLAVQVAALAATAWMFHTAQGGLALLAAILVFIAAFAMALGPVGWIICSEIFPTRVRGRAMSLAAFTVWLTCYAVAQTFPMLNDSPAIGPAKTFSIYGVVSLVGLVFVLFRVPETKGKTLEQIEASWRR
jgi:SP family arabinose:H+ symporter-like MFS transporter